MKTRYLFFALALVSALATGCKDEETVQAPETNTQNNSNAMTADQQKEYLQNSAQTILSTFKTADQKEAVELADGLYDKYQNYDWQAIGEKLADIEDGRYESFFSAPKRLVALTQGLAAPSANDLMVFSFNGCAYNFEIDEAKQTINYSKSNDGTCTATFRDKAGHTCTLRAWGEGKVSSYSYTFSTDRGNKTIQADIPAKTCLSLKQGNTEVIGFAFGLDAAKNNHLYTTLDLKVTNVIIKYDIRVNSTNGSALYELKYGDKNLITAALDLPKYKLIDKADNQDWEEWLEQYEERYEELFRAIGSGSGQLSIMNLITLKGSINSGAQLYEDIEHMNKIEEGSKQGVQDFCSKINKNCTAGLYFPQDPNTLQISLRLQPRAREYERYNYETQTYSTVTEYRPELVLFFPKDQTSYSFAEYFTMDRFSSVIQMAEQVINSYIDLDKEFGLEHVDLY
ncbi:MAG: hypothetical protein IJQ95_04005 [Paludibacteraceae bacterium]|nr:hypothetical protein [Paludibacteraceae bacterium]